MSDSENPYESPQAEAGTITPLSGRVLTEEMLYYLKGASPWLRFVGIAGFICLGGVVLIVMLSFFYLGQMLPDGPETVFLKVLMPGILPFLAIYFFPILFLFRFGKKIKSYLYSSDDKDLEEAFKNNKSLWTFMGVLAIIGLSSTVLMVIGGIITAIAVAVTGALG